MLSRHQFCSLFSTGLPSLYWGDKLCSLVPHCDFANRGSYKYLLQLLSMSGSYVKMEDSCGYGTACEQVTVLCGKPQPLGLTERPLLQDTTKALF